MDGGSRAWITRLARGSARRAICNGRTTEVLVSVPPCAPPQGVQGRLRGFYRPRRPREDPLWKVLSDHFTGFVSQYDARYRPSWGHLRPVVLRAVGDYLGCGLPERGFARIVCPSCRAEYLLAFSCKTRGLCTSCGAKRAAAWAAWVRDELARAVPHRQIVVTLPKMLRPLFLRQRSLLTDLSRWIYECLCQVMAALAPEPVRPGAVAAIELSGNLLNLQPHVHMIVTDGAFDPSGTRFYRLNPGFLRPLEVLLRRRVLRKLSQKGVLPPERARLLLSWRHSGFSVHAGAPIPPSDAGALERLARYLRRLHLAESKILYDEAHDRVIYGSGKKPHPGFQANFRVFEARDFVAQVTGFIPEPWQHETIAYGEYSNVVRGRRRRAPEEGGLAILSPRRRAVRLAWRDLLVRIYEVDPLLCPCGDRLRIVGLVTDRAAIEATLTHLGLWPPPPPRLPRTPRPPPSPPPSPLPSPVSARIRPRDGPDESEAEASQVPAWWDDDAAYSQVPKEGPG